MLSPSFLLLLMLDCLNDIVGFTPKECDCLIEYNKYPVLDLGQGNAVIVQVGSTLPIVGKEIEYLPHGVGDEWLTLEVISVEQIDNAYHLTVTDFDNIIHSYNSACFRQKVELTESLSGYYIDDMENGIELVIPQQSADCGDGSIWDIMARARKEGVRDFLTDFSAALQSYSEQGFFPFNGWIGDEKNNSWLNITSPYIGMRLSMKSFKGASMRFKSYVLHINESRDVDVYLINRSGEILYSNTVTTVANTPLHTALDNHIDLPFSSLGSPETYYLIYDLGTSKPRNYKFNCGCGGSGSKPWEKYIQGEGIMMQEVGNQTFGLASRHTNGLRIEVELMCNGMEWLCEQNDFILQPFARVMAKTLQLYQINKLIGSVLNSTRINRFTLLSKEHLYGKRNHNRKEYEWRIAWLAANMPPNATSCFVCKTNIRKGMIRV